jgi:hypothetical protein
VDLNIHETDILAADLEVVFCGLNLATTAAAAIMDAVSLLSSTN